MTVDELVLRQVEVAGALADVRVSGGVIAEVALGLHPSPGAAVIDGGGGALLPGLHDHHIHLLATAAMARSVRVGPSEVRDLGGLAATLHRADRALADGRWLRAVGYHASVAGDLDRVALDALVPNRPTRVQDRSGARWTLNSAAINALGLDDHDRSELERDASGRLTGRLHRGDGWLRTLLPEEPEPDLAEIGRQLASRGVTGVTDATPYSTVGALEPLRRAVADGSLPQQVWITGGPELTAIDPPDGLHLGPVKLLIDDDAYPALDDLVDWVTSAHAHGRNVAVHCVTRAAIVLALAAWDAAGSRPGDRVEHGFVIPPVQIVELARHGITVVTQPGFVTERGDEYLREVEPADLPYLYPCRSLLAAGVPVAGSTDAPYTDADPWRAMDAAVSRRAPSGAVLGADEVIPPRRALDLFLGHPASPGGPPRQVAVGAAADLCVLDRPLPASGSPWAEVRVVHTVIGGALTS
jgi:predicted amidohydrolase YtcJ